MVARHTEDLGRQGIDLFKTALNLADTPEFEARVEMASLSAYRLTLGPAWLGQEPEEDLTDANRQRLRDSARRLFELCAKHEIKTVHEARRTADAEAAVRKALGMKDDEPFQSRLRPQPKRSAVRGQRSETCPGT